MVSRKVTRSLVLMFSVSVLCSATALAQNTPVTVNVVLENRYISPHDDTVIAMIEVQGNADALTCRSPVAMALVIDTSGSMEGDKIVAARAAAHALIDRLSSDDVISLITYADSSITHLANYQISTNRTTAHAAIDRITATGSTCISCGLEQAYTLLSDFSNRYTRRVVMLSDGNANRGITDSSGLRNLASAALESHGVPSSTIGLGFDYNEDLMTSIANGGAGAYYFLPDGEAVATILDREFSNLETTVAGNLTIELTPAHGVSFANIDLPGAVMNGNRLVLSMGQLGAGAMRQLLVSLNLPSGELGSVVSVRASFTDNEGDDRSMEVVANLERSDDPATVTASANQDVVVRWEQVESARGVARAMENFQQGNREAARRDLRERAEQLRQDATTMAAPQLAAEAAAVDRLVEALDDDVSSQRVDGLRRHNYSRAREREQGIDDDAMYYNEMFY